MSRFTKDLAFYANTLNKLEFSCFLFLSCAGFDLLEQNVRKVEKTSSSYFVSRKCTCLKCVNHICVLCQPYLMENDQGILCLKAGSSAAYCKRKIQCVIPENILTPTTEGISRKPPSSPEFPFFDH